MPSEEIGKCAKNQVPGGRRLLGRELLAHYAQGVMDVFSPHAVELPVDPDILAREKKFCTQDSKTREAWVLKYVILCKEGLEVLEKIRRDRDMVESFAYYASPKGRSTGGPCKKVRASLPCEGELETVRAELEKKLKLDLLSRGSNAGVFFRMYQRGGIAYAEAIPAILDGE